MATSTAKTPDTYVASLPPDRATEIAKVRALVNARIQPGFEEGISYGMLSWHAPSSRLPVTYNGAPFSLVCLASQKNYMSLYLLGPYTEPATAKRFHAAYKKSGKKLDMGKSCIRFKSADDLAFDAIGDAVAEMTIARWVAIHDEHHSKSAVTARRAKASKTPPKKAQKKAPAKTKRR